MKLISSEKSHNQNSGEDGEGCTAVSEIALFIDNKLLDQPDPLVKLHSKNRTKNLLSLPSVAKGSKHRLQRPLGEVHLFFFYGKYTQNNFLGHYSSKTLICSDKKTRREVTGFYVNSILDPKHYYGAVFKHK